ncbi:MAG TPA: hypothetical protein VGY56_14295 [Verrucomicrobiae bacterium]|nr:hypothetical protein [Verrucomicrobiae bacterium]
MNAAFITCLVCALMSIVAILGASAMDVVPGAESWRDIAMLASIAFFLVWIALAFWLRPRPNQARWPRWARTLVISAGIVYVLGVLLPVIG